MKLIGFAIYLAIGAMLHALVVGPAFDWSSAWTFAWLFGWPIMLIVTFGAVIIIGLSIAVIIWAGWSWIDTLAKWRERRRS